MLINRQKSKEIVVEIVPKNANQHYVKSNK